MTAILFLLSSVKPCNTGGDHICQYLNETRVMNIKIPWLTPMKKCSIFLVDLNKKKSS
jgi:hypothetical protein